MLPFVLRSFRADDFIDWIFPTGRARDIEVESILKPKNSSFWIGFLWIFRSWFENPVTPEEKLLVLYGSESLCMSLRQ